MESNPLVSISCLTYNHANYIREAIDGFLMQKTNFPFEVLIHDDASTDGTEEIIREYEAKYPEIIKPLYEKENQWQKGRKGSVVFNFPRARGKYIALCEGDDYWTDPYKLQKQVDYMEKNLSCSLCFHPVNIVKDFKKTNETIKISNNDEILKKNKLYFSFGHQSPTASLLFRSSHIKHLPDWFLKAPVGDVPLKLFLSQKGYFFYKNEVMAIRRINVPNSWNDEVRNNRKKEINYFIGMIKMIEGFNYYTDFKYFENLTKKEIFYAKRILFLSKGFSFRWAFFKKNIIEHTAINLANKTKLFFICLMPRVINFILKIKKIIKNFSRKKYQYYY